MERALSKSVYPQLEKELRLALLEEAKDGILRVCVRVHSFAFVLLTILL